MYNLRKILSGLSNLRNVSLLISTIEVAPLVPRSKCLYQNFSTSLLRCSAKTQTSEKSIESKAETEELKQLVDVLNAKKASDSMSWMEVRESLATKENRISISAQILQACISLMDVDLGMSYYKSMIDSKQKFSNSENVLLLKLLVLDTSKIKDYEELLIDLYKEFKPFVGCNVTFQTYILRVFSCIQSCWEDMVEIIKGDEQLTAKGSSLITSAFKYNRPEIGWELLNKYPFVFSSQCVSEYLDYCIRKAEKKEFSPSLINDLVQYCNDQAMFISGLETLSKLQTLTSVLNSDPHRTYSWNVASTFIENKNLCINCKSRLGSVNISEKELEELKNDLVQDVIINKNINIKTSEQELRRFMKFLKQCSSYDIVIDALNFLYQHKSRDKALRVIKHFLRKGMKILLIGKQHICNDREMFSFLRQNCQIFLTKNSSDDDVFVLYAALHGGLNTFFLTSDFFRGYGSRIQSKELRNIFLKWKIMRQYHFSYDNKKEILPPKMHSTLPQITCGDTSQKHLSWHLSIQKAYSLGLTVALDVDIEWICLRASAVS